MIGESAFNIYKTFIERMEQEFLQNIRALFGISVTFVSPDKKKYLKIVEDIASKRGLKIDIETLHSEALKWEIRYNGRSPRTARQFIDWIEAQQ